MAVGILLNEGALGEHVFHDPSSFSCGWGTGTADATDVVERRRREAEPIRAIQEATQGRRGPQPGRNAKQVMHAECRHAKCMKRKV